MLNTSFQFPTDVARYPVSAVDEQLQSSFGSKLPHDAGPKYQDGTISSPERRNSLFSSAEVSSTSSPTSPRSKNSSHFARESIDSFSYPKKPVHRRSNTEISSNESEKDFSSDFYFKSQYRDTKVKPSPFQASSSRNSVPVYRKTTLDAPTTVTIDIDEMTKGLCDAATKDGARFIAEKQSVYIDRTQDTHQPSLRRSVSAGGFFDLQKIEEETTRPHESQIVDIYCILREGPPS